MFADLYYIHMSKNEQTKLSPIERIVRNKIIKQLADTGFTVTFIANVMSGVTTSTVSRVITKDNDFDKQLDELLLG